MATASSLAKINNPLPHLPTWFFIIGYPIFWLELSTSNARQGVTSPIAWILWGCVLLISLFLAKCKCQNYLKNLKVMWSFLEAKDKFLWIAGLILAVLILGIVSVASLKPIHLIQEFDCLKYHYTIPRQHLITGSFADIPWAAFDLFLLPVDFALAPFWFVTALPNKIPQLIILFGLISVVMRLTTVLAGDKRPWAGPFVGLLILGTHGFGIQMGTGMLDLSVAYLFFASLDSLRLGNWFLAGVEFTFFFWSKPILPLEVSMSIAILAFIFILLRWWRWQIIETFRFKHWKAAVLLFIILSIVVGGPFIFKSIYYAATPIYPLAPGVMGAVGQIKIHPEFLINLKQTSQLCAQEARSGYGYGRDLLSFVKHWWLLAVPQKGVNNAFDYLLGLTYLLMIGPFLFFWLRDIFHRKFCPLSFLVIISWGLWWFTTQQSRFLYLPLLIIFMVTIARLEKIPRVLFLGVLISLFFEFFSVLGAHKADFSRWGIDDLRVEDKQLMLLNYRTREHLAFQAIEWPSDDVAYAKFPVIVHKTCP